MTNVVQLRATGTALTVRAAADAFLDSVHNPNTRRAYTTTVGRIADDVTTGGARAFADVADDEIGEALERHWGAAAVNTWNARRAAALSWSTWAAERGIPGPSVPAWAKRHETPGSDTPVRSRTAIDRLCSRRDVPVREKTLYRMLYETAARVDELLGVNVEDLDLAARCCLVKAKGARPKVRRRGAARDEYVMEKVYWDAGTARLLPRLLKDRTAGPVFVTERRPGARKAVTSRDVCPDTGRARLSYGQARALLDRYTQTNGIGTGWDPHQFRHSSLTHLGESGASLMLLMAKSRHKKPENVRRYFKPSDDAMRDLTSLLAPGDR